MRLLKHIPAKRRPRLDRLIRTRRSFRKPLGREGDEGELVPVEPTRPNTLSGGAAAELEFEQ